MRRFRQGSIARRFAISAFALYALLLQGFLAAAAPGAAIGRGVSFGSRSSTPGGDPVHHHGLCILACAAAACGYAGTASAVVVFSTLVASAIDFAPAPGLAARPPIKFCGARSSRRPLIAPPRG
jgi:hypothetical protein